MQHFVVFARSTLHHSLTPSLTHSLTFTYSQSATLLYCTLHCVLVSTGSITYTISSGGHSPVLHSLHPHSPTHSLTQSLTMLSSLRLPQVPNMPPPRVLPGKGSGGGGGGGSGGGSPDKLPRGLSKKQSRTISQRFIRAPLYDISQFVWIEEEESVWILCTILKQDNTVLMLQDVESAVVYKIDIGFDEVLFLRSIYTVVM